MEAAIRDGRTPHGPQRFYHISHDILLYRDRADCGRFSASLERKLPVSPMALQQVSNLVEATRS